MGLAFSADAILACIVVFGTLVAIAVTTAPAEVILVGAMILLMALNVVTPEQALQGFSNTGVLTIAVLYVVVAGLRETGAIYWLSHVAFRRPRSLLGAQSQLMTVTAVVSSMVNNTPVVAMFIPIAQEWSKRYGFPLSKLLMPMNCITILAGLCTLIGTSTNLLVNSLMEKHVGGRAFGLFDIAAVGLPLTVAGFLYVLLLGRRLLPDRKGPVEQLENAREYAFEARVVPSGGLVGKTIAEVGLRSMRNAYVLEIERGDNLVTAVGPGEVLQAEDRIVCVGVVDAVMDIRRIPGLAVAEEQAFKLNLKNSQRRLVEVVLSGSSPLVGSTVREAQFRGQYSAAIISISRDGRRLSGKVGDIALRSGDTLLIEAADDFAERHRYDRDFLLVSQLRDSAPPDFRRAPIAAGILAVMVAAVVTGVTSLVEAAFIAAAFMLLTGCVTRSVARKSIEYGIVVSIAASFALGVALTESGAAEQIAGGISAFSGTNPFVILVVLYVATVVLTELVTNTACAVVMFPIAVSLSERADVSLYPFVVAVMVAASAGFMTPIGYQTNLMIYGPGGYRFSDFVRFGAPLSLITGIIALWIIPLVWPL
jgi:di/tricarboxylate transporter